MQGLVNSYDGKSAEYFAHPRASQVSALLPGPVDRVLDVGCGAGRTLADLRASGACRWTAGIELVPEAAHGARNAGIDVVIEGSVEEREIERDFAPRSLDAILCLDVLEHLLDPWTTVRRLSALLSPNGVLIASLPNVRNTAVVLPLLFRGRWSYGPFGLLDRTHLRFFTRESAVALLESGGLRVDLVRPVGTDWSVRKRVARTLTFGAFDDLFAFQYLLRARAGT